MTLNTAISTVTTSASPALLKQSAGEPTQNGPSDAFKVMTVPRMLHRNRVLVGLSDLCPQFWWGLYSCCASVPARVGVPRCFCAWARTLPTEEAVGSEGNL